MCHISRAAFLPPFDFVDFDFYAYQMRTSTVVPNVIRLHLPSTYRSYRPKWKRHRRRWKACTLTNLHAHNIFCNIIYICCAMPRTYRNRWNAMTFISKFRALLKHLAWVCLRAQACFAVPPSHVKCAQVFLYRRRTDDNTVKGMETQNEQMASREEKKRNKRICAPAHTARERERVNGNVK